MKKTRILAALVSLMMVVCALPVMQASAASPALAPSNLGAAVAEVMNTISGSDKVETAIAETNPGFKEIINYFFRR